MCLRFLSLLEKLLAHPVKNGAHLVQIVFGRLCVDHNACRSKSRSKGQSRDANERCLKAIRQGEGELDLLFRVPLDIKLN